MRLNVLSGILLSNSFSDFEISFPRSSLSGERRIQYALTVKSLLTAFPTYSLITVLAGRFQLRMDETNTARCIKAIITHLLGRKEQAQGRGSGYEAGCSRVFEILHAPYTLRNALGKTKHGNGLTQGTADLRSPCITTLH